MAEQAPDDKDAALEHLDLAERAPAPVSLPVPVPRPGEIARQRGAVQP